MVSAVTLTACIHLLMVLGYQMTDSKNLTERVIGNVLVTTMLAVDGIFLATWLFPMPGS